VLSKLNATRRDGTSSLVMFVSIIFKGLTCLNTTASVLCDRQVFRCLLKRVATMPTLETVFRHRSLRGGTGSMARWSDSKH
jgi:hypothetical protein